MTDAILRQWAMLKRVPRAPASVTAAELQQQLRDEGYNTSLRTIQRDLLTLSAAFPLYCDEQATPYRWQWAPQAQVLDIPGMSPQAALAFKLVDEYLKPLLPKSTLAGLAPYFSTAAGVLAQSGTSALERWPEKVAIISSGPPLLPPKLDDAVLAVVYEALFRERRFRAIYHSIRHPEGKEYLFNPLGLVFRDSVIYLVATLWEYQDVKQFALHRMGSAALLVDQSLRINGFNLDEYISQHEFEYPLSSQPQEIELELSIHPRLARILSETPLSRTQRISDLVNGKQRLNAIVSNTKNLIIFLLSHGTEVEVLAPAFIRERVINRACFEHVRDLELSP